MMSSKMMVYSNIFSELAAKNKNAKHFQLLSNRPRDLFGDEDEKGVIKKLINQLYIHFDNVKTLITYSKDQLKDV